MKNFIPAVAIAVGIAGCGANTSQEFAQQAIELQVQATAAQKRADALNLGEEGCQKVLKVLESNSTTGNIYSNFPTVIGRIYDDIGMASRRSTGYIADDLSVDQRKAISEILEQSQINGCQFHGQLNNNAISPLFLDKNILTASNFLAYNLNHGFGQGFTKDPLRAK